MLVALVIVMRVTYRARSRDFWIGREGRQAPLLRPKIWKNKINIQKKEKIYQQDNIKTRQWHVMTKWTPLTPQAVVIVYTLFIGSASRVLDKDRHKHALLGIYIRVLQSTCTGVTASGWIGISNWFNYAGRVISPLLSLHCELADPSIYIMQTQVFAHSLASTKTCDRMQRYFCLYPTIYFSYSPIPLF